MPGANSPADPPFPISTQVASHNIERLWMTDGIEYHTAIVDASAESVGPVLPASCAFLERCSPAFVCCASGQGLSLLEKQRAHKCPKFVHIVLRHVLDLIERKAQLPSRCARLTWPHRGVAAGSHSRRHPARCCALLKYSLPSPWPEMPKTPPWWWP